MGDTRLPEKPLISATGLAADLTAREAAGNPVRVCVIGTGEMGTDLVTAICQMRGVEIATIVDRSLTKAMPAMEIAGYDDDMGIVCDSASAITKNYESCHIPIIQDAHEALSHDLVDVVIDSTGVPEAGKHLVMMNVEADVSVGAMMQDVAAKKGLVYTVGAGDEPSSVMEMYDRVTALGYPIAAVPDDYRGKPSGAT